MFLTNKVYSNFLLPVATKQFSATTTFSPFGDKFVKEGEKKESIFYIKKSILYHSEAQENISTVNLLRCLE